MLKREIMENWVKENPCVERWLQRVSPSTARRYRDYAYKYFDWVWENGGEFAHKTPGELLDLQDTTSGRDRFKQLDLLQRWVNGQPKAKKSKSTIYTTIRSFYGHNRVPLPRDLGFRMKSDREPVIGELHVEGLKKIVFASSLRYRAAFLCMFQSAMGEGEFEYFNQAWDQVKPQLEAGKKSLKIRLPGRKHAKNERPYYTFIGRDGVQALKEYIERERGFIKPGEAIFLNDKLNPVTKANIRVYFHRMAEKVGLIEKPYPQCPKCGADTIRKRRRPGRRGEKRTTKVYYRCTNPKCGLETPATKEYHIPKTVRYKVHAHEMRDLFRSEWDLSPAKGVCAEFFLGHGIDPNMYNKIMKLHPDWAEGQYALAQPYLNILSEDPRKVSINQVRELQKENIELRETITRMENRLKILEEEDRKWWSPLLLEDFFKIPEETRAELYRALEEAHVRAQKKKSKKP